MATQTDLDQARAAYHALMTGKSVSVVVDQNGERVEFRATNKASLNQYIKDLEKQLGGTSSNRPLRPFF